MSVGFVNDVTMMVTANPKPELASIIENLQSAERHLTVYMKSRIAVFNRLRMCVATVRGYSAGMEEKDRKAAMEKAEAEVARLYRSPLDENDMLSGLVKNTYVSIDSFIAMEQVTNALLEKAASKLPVAKWLSEPEQRGVGLKLLGRIIGECGDLGNYETPGKLWKRMGCAPIESRGKMLMPSTWRSGVDGKLSAAEWEEAGYCPRRRSIMYLAGDCLVKLNCDGPYRRRWLHGKTRTQETHPEWKWLACDKKVTEKRDGKTVVVAKCVLGVLDGEMMGEVCPTCDGTGKKCGRAHNHGMLLASKLFLKNLWIEWNTN